MGSGYLLARAWSQTMGHGDGFVPVQLDELVPCMSPATGRVMAHRYVVAKRPLSRWARDGFFAGACAGLVADARVPVRACVRECVRASVCATVREVCLLPYEYSGWRGTKYCVESGNFFGSTLLRLGLDHVSGQGISDPQVPFPLSKT